MRSVNLGESWSSIRCDDVCLDQDQSVSLHSWNSVCVHYDEKGDHRVHPYYHHPPVLLVRNDPREKELIHYNSVDSYRVSPVHRHVQSTQKEQFQNHIPPIGFNFKKKCVMLDRIRLFCATS